ncbi:MAG: insulinase family protein [Bacteroidales bacterium]|nr:insulinase family protein [Bacteroidales bacterium]
METQKKDILKFSFKRSASPVAYCALSAKCGTRNEDPKFNGLAHFTEHMFFKGTAARKANAINNVLERVGGELNAYTTKEETVLHSTLLKEDLPKAIDLLMELAFSSTFPQKELEKERDVIIEEIVSYKDMPADAIYEHFEQLLFEGHPLQMQILGEKKSLAKIDSGIMKDYNTLHFTPSNMAFTIVADWDEGKAASLVKKSARKYLGREVDLEIVQEGDMERPDMEHCYREEWGKKPLFHKTVAKRNHQAHCIVGAEAYNLYDPKRIALSILTNILGGPASGSRLNMALRERNGLVYSVEAVYTPYADTGIFSIYFGCDKEDVEKCLALIKKELDRIVSAELTPSALKAAKKQLIGQLSIAQDNAEAQCLSMGKSLMVYGKISNFEQMRSRIESITPAHLLEVAKEILCWERMNTLIYS